MQLQLDILLGFLSAGSCNFRIWGNCLYYAASVLELFRINLACVLWGRVRLTKHQSCSPLAVMSSSGDRTTASEVRELSRTEAGFGLLMHRVCESVLPPQGSKSTKSAREGLGVEKPPLLLTLEKGDSCFRLRNSAGPKRGCLNVRA